MPRDGGELGYSLSDAHGAAFDNPDLIVGCVVGDAEGTRSLPRPVRARHAGHMRNDAGGSPPVRPLPEILDDAQCLTYLAAGTVGRFLFVTARGPVAIPVNYQLHRADVVFRTSEFSLAAGVYKEPVSFEIDHFDDTTAEGWSVLVSGTSRIVTDPADLDELRSVANVPWAGGDRETFIRIVATQISGRRIRSHR